MGARGPGRAGGGALALLGGAGLLCLAAVLLAAALGPVPFPDDSPLDRLVLRDRPLDAERPPVEEAVVPRPDPLPDDPTGAVPLEVVAALLLTTVVLALLVRSLLHAGAPDDAEDPEVPDPPATRSPDPAALGHVADAARRGLHRLGRGTGGTATEDVLACWVELEAAAARLGSGPTWTDTPTDFAARLSRVVPGLDTDVLDELRRTYSRVRYGGRGAGPGDVRQAREALTRLLAAVEAAGRSPSGRTSAAVPR